LAPCDTDEKKDGLSHDDDVYGGIYLTSYTLYDGQQHTTFVTTSLADVSPNFHLLISSLRNSRWYAAVENSAPPHGALWEKRKVPVW
jgi:hypothetical protein